MKIKEITEHASAGACSSGAIASSTAQPGPGQFFGGNPNSSVYSSIKRNRSKNKKKLKENFVSDKIQDLIDSLNKTYKIPDYTCPKINDVIYELEVTKNMCINKIVRNYESVADFAWDIEDHIKNALRGMENIRTANDQLQTLGIEWHEATKEAKEIASKSYNETEFQPFRNES